MTALVTVEEVQAQTDRVLTDAQKTRATSEILALQAAIESWANVKLTSETITDEYHRLLFDTDRVIPYYPALSITGIKLYDKSATLDTTYNTYLQDATFGYPTTVYLTYVTDPAPVEPYLPIIKNLIIGAVLNGALKPDVVKYGVLSGYSVEGTTITYRTQDANGQVASFAVADLAPLSRMRRLVVM